MKIFLSWSGTRSKKVAESLVEWLPLVSQTLEPFLSSRDLTKGAVWDTQLSGELKETNFGILCLTKENLYSPWILFEAGALFKGSTENRVCTLLVDLVPSDVEQPLAKFNHTALTQKEDMRRLVRHLHKSSMATLPEKLLDVSFDNYWNKFNENIGSVPVTVKR